MRRRNPLPHNPDSFPRTPRFRWGFLGTLLRRSGAPAHGRRVAEYPLERARELSEHGARHAARIKGRHDDRREIEQEILTLIESSIEDTRVPDAIAAHADKRAGKPVTKTDSEQLEAQLGVPVRISRQYRMTWVAWTAGQEPNPWSDERAILIAHSDTNVRWPTGDELRKKEPAYFGARDERNEARKKLLQEHTILRDAIDREIPRTEDESTIYRAAQAIIKLREAREELLRLIDYGQHLHVVRTPVEKLAVKE